MLNAPRCPGLFFREENPKPLSYFRTDCGVVGWIEVGRISHEPPFHINTRTSPIPTRVYMPVIATPRQTSDMTLSDSRWICLLRTGASRRRICRGPIASRGNREIVPSESTKVNLRKRGGAIPAYVGGCSSPLSQPITLSGLIGSGWSHSKHWNIRDPFPSEGAATTIRYAPHLAHLNRSSSPMP